MFPRLHDRTSFFTFRSRQPLIFFSVTSLSELCSLFRTMANIVQVPAGRSNAARFTWTRHESPFVHLTCVERTLSNGVARYERRAKTIRIEGTGHGSLMRTGTPYSGGPRCWITQNTYQFYIGFLGAATAPCASERIRAFFAPLLVDVYTACSFARKWINVINGQRGKSSSGNWFSCRGCCHGQFHCSILPGGQNSRMPAGGRGAVPPRRDGKKIECNWSATLVEKKRSFIAVDSGIRMVSLRVTAIPQRFCTNSAASKHAVEQW